MVLPAATSTTSSPSNSSCSSYSTMASPSQHHKTNTLSTNTGTSSNATTAHSSSTSSSPCPTKGRSPPPRRKWWHCHRRFHLTGGGVWCLWYSLSVALFTGYLVYRGVHRFLAAASLPWPEDEAPYVALNAYVGLVGAAVVLTPFLLLTSLHKVGNLANDGVQLGTSLSTCSSDPPVLPLPTPGIIRMVWTHGPPTAAFLHLLSAFCLLLPHTLLDAQLLHAGLLPKSEIWSTDMDLFVPHEDRIAVLATLQPPVPTIPTTTSLPLMNPVVSVGALDHLEAARGVNLRPRGGDLRSASLLRLSDAASSASSTAADRGYFSAGGSYLGNDGGVGPTAEFLRNGGKNSNLNNLYSQNGRRNNIDDRSKFNDVPSLGKLPVGSTIPLANLNVNIPTSRSSSSSIPSLSRELDSTITSVSGGEGSGASATKQQLPLGRGLVWKPVSPEFLNYVVALLLFSIRYPSVFWGTNKGFSLLFSLQLLLTAGQTVFLTCAFTILYKLHLMGGVLELHGTDELLLSLPVTVTLFTVTVLLLAVSSSAVYLHGYHKFVTFVARSRQRYQITYKDEPVPMGAYTGHIAGLVVLVLLCLCSGPLVWDLSRVYRGSLDQVVLISVISTIVHIFAWIALWLIFTVKTRWTFKLRVTVARACVSSARSIKLVNDVELQQAEEGATGPCTAPLLVVGSGRAFNVPEMAHKKAIMGVVQKSQSALAEGDSAVYWHRPTPPTLSPRPTRAHTKGGDSATPSTSKGKGGSNGKKSSKNRAVSPMSESEDDAGDYALLLEEGGIKGARTMSPNRQEGGRQPPKLTRAASASAADTRYVDRRQILAYRRENEQLQQQLQQQQQQESCSGGTEEDNDVMPPLPPPPPGLGGPSHEGQGPSTPRSTRSPDSGLVVHDDQAIHRSDSTSTTTSSTATNHQPDQSTSSTNTATNQSEQSDNRNRCGSDEELCQLPADPNNFPSYPRPLRSLANGASGGVSSSGNGSGGLYNDSTVVIRRQRNLTRELQPPVDPIYATRSITSFKEDPIYGGRGSGLQGSGLEEGIYGGQHNQGAISADDILARAQNTVNSQHYGSNTSGSAGYHTASNSSGSNSPVPPPTSTTPGLATPPPPMQPLYPHHKPMLGHGIYGHTSRIGSTHGMYGQTSSPQHPIYGGGGGAQSPVHHGMYGRTGKSNLPQAPQIPLPPIPQGSIPPNIHYGAKADQGDDGDFPPPPLSSPSPLSPPPGDLYPGGSSGSSHHSRYAGGGVGGSGNRVVSVGRSSSLRFAPGTPPRHFTNSLPHVIPSRSHYNTGV